MATRLVDDVIDGATVHLGLDQRDRPGAGAAGRVPPDEQRGPAWHYAPVRFSNRLAVAEVRRQGSLARPRVTTSRKAGPTDADLHDRLCPHFSAASLPSREACPAARLSHALGRIDIPQFLPPLSPGTLLSRWRRRRCWPCWRPAGCWGRPIRSLAAGACGACGQRFVGLVVLVLSQSGAGR